MIPYALAALVLLIWAALIFAAWPKQRDASKTLAGEE